MRYLSLYLLLNYFVMPEKINIANCNELWGMTNTMNSQPLYAMKIYSCIVHPTLDIVTEKIPNILNLSNQTIFNNSNHNSSLQIIPSASPMTPSPMSPSHMTPSSMTPSPSATLQSPDLNSLNPSPVSVPLSPSPNKQQTTPSSGQKTLEPTNFEEELTNLKLTSSPSPSEIPLINDPTTPNTVGLTIVIIIVSIILLIVVIFVIFKYKKNKIGDKNITNDNLNNHASNTKPHKFNTSPSSKTEDTLVSSPRTHPTSHQPPPPKKPPSKRKNKLPKLPTNAPILDNSNVSQHTVPRLRPSRMPNNTSNTLNRVKNIHNMRDLESGIKTSS